MERFAGGQALLIRGGQLVLPDRVITGDLAVENGMIIGIWQQDQVGGQEAVAAWLEQQTHVQTIEAAGKYVLPGLVDIHCDAIEKEVQPRPGTLFPLDLALLEFERSLPVHGITTMYHSLSLGVGLSLRGDHLMTQMIESIHAFRKQRASIRNRIHLRYEISYLAGKPIAEKYIQEKTVDYLSFMDHSPGQGQYRRPGAFAKYVMKNQGVDEAEVEQIITDLMQRREQIEESYLQQLGQAAREAGIALASHDDDLPELVDVARGRSVSVCEFPINLETAKYAVDQGLDVCVGAPNVVRGGSHDLNLRAVDAIAAGAATILCSDYHPSSMLAAIFKLYQEGVVSLSEAANMASLNPLRALGADEQLGSLAIGKAADMLIVDTFEELPYVTHTFVSGHPVYIAASLPIL